MSEQSEPSDGSGAASGCAGPGWGHVWLTVAIVCVLHLAGTLLTAVDGPLVIDELVYRDMARAVVARARLDLDVGYRDHPSPELLNLLFDRLGAGRVWSQYPPTAALLAAPLTLVMGDWGPLALSALAFVAVLVLIVDVARRLGWGPPVALAALGILVLASFCWDYSQSALPHLPAAALVLAAFDLALASAACSRRRWAGALAVLTGLTAGVAVTVRLDAVVALPAVVAVVMLLSPTRMLPTSLVLAGWIPPVAALGTLNRIRFGTLNPFSYGVRPTGSVHAGTASVLALAGVAVVGLAAWLLTSSRSPAVRTAAATLALCVAWAAAAALAPSSVSDLPRRAAGVLVDVRVLPVSAAGPGQVRSESGEILYLGAHKKALLQSLPYLSLLVLPLVAVIRGDSEARRLTALGVPVVATAAVMSAVPYHGGQCLNMRYATSAVPFCCLLAGWALLRLLKWAAFDHRGAWSVLTVAGGTVVVLAVCLRTAGGDVSRQARVLLDAPLPVAALVALAAVAAALLPATPRRAAARAATIAAGVALAVAAVSVWGYDVPRHRLQRVEAGAAAKAIAQVIGNGGILFSAPYIDPALAARRDSTTRIALPANDGFESFVPLIEASFREGRRAWGLFSVARWKSLQATALAGRGIVPAWSFYEVFDSGPNLRSLGPWATVRVSSPEHGYVLAEITQATRR